MPENRGGRTEQTVSSAEASAGSQNCDKSPTQERTLDELRALAGRLFMFSDDERRRVARELHDDICQKLAVLEIDVQQIEPVIVRDPEQARRDLEKAMAGIGSLSDAVRRISRSLHPSAIDDLGLAAALRSLLSDFREHEHLKVTFTAQHLPEEIPGRIATALYRIAQEALRNVAQHAGKTHATVSLRGTASGIRLQVIDFGTGFDVHAHRSGLGIVGMEERAHMIRGSCRVESKPGAGAKVTVVVPWSSP